MIERHKNLPLSQSPEIHDKNFASEKFVTPTIPSLRWRPIIRTRGKSTEPGDARKNYSHA